MQFYKEDNEYQPFSQTQKLVWIKTSEHPSSAPGTVRWGVLFSFLTAKKASKRRKHLLAFKGWGYTLSLLRSHVSRSLEQQVTCVHSQEEKANTHVELAFSFLFHLGSQPMEWFHPHLWNVIPSQLTQARNYLRVIWPETCLIGDLKSYQLMINTNHQRERTER